MDITTRGTQKMPILLAYGLLWLSGFLIMACFYSLPIVTVLRPPHPGQPPQPGDWRLPVLGAALFTSVMICQEWYTRKNGKPRFKPKKLLNPAAEKKRKIIVGLLLTMPVLLVDCFCAFMSAHRHVSWPLLLLLNVGEAAGWGGLWWAQRLLPDPPGPDVDPLTLAVASPMVANAVRTEWLPEYSVARRTPTEIELQVPSVMRYLHGALALVLATATVLSVVTFYAPRYFGLSGAVPPKFDLTYLTLTLVVTLFLGLSAFLMLCGCGPRELRLTLDARTYTLVFWKPIPGSSPSSGLAVPFKTQRVSGCIDVDIAGVGLHESRNKYTSYLLLKIVWKDAARPPQILRGFRDAEEARAAMLAASAALGLPALGRIE